MHGREEQNTQRTQRSSAWRITAGAALVLVLIWSAIAYQLSESRAAALGYARQEGRNLANVVGEHFSSYIANVDLWVRQLRKEWQRDPRHFAQAVALKRALLGGDSIVAGTRIVDRSGRVVFSDTAGGTQNAFVGDRLYFRIHAEAGKPRDELYISDPIVGRTSGRVLIPLSRPILGPEGEFRGVIVLALSLEQLIKTYREITHGSNSFVTVRRPTGEVLASSTEYDKVLNRSMRTLPHGPNDPLAGSFVRPASIDGIERLFTYQRLPAHDLVVVVAKPTEELLSAYHQQRRVYLGGGLLLSLAVVLLALLAHRRIGRDGQSGERQRRIIALQTRLSDERLDLRAMCDLVVAATREIVGSGAAAIQFVEGEEFVYFAVTEERRQIVGARTSLKGNFSAAILESGKAILCEDTQSDPRIDAAASLRAGARSLIGAPMYHEDRVVGVLKLLSGEPRAFRADQLPTLELLAGIAGSAIQRKRAQEDLRRSEERFRSLTHLSSDWYWEQDASFRFTKFEGRSRFVLAEILGKCVWDLRGIVRDSADWQALRRAMHAHEAFRQFVYCYETRAGERHYISADGEPVFDEKGGFAGYRGTSRDITAQRRGEEALRRFRAAMDMSHDAVYLTDRATLRFVDLNEAACKGTGYSREELMRVGPERVLGKPREELEREYDAVIAAGADGVTTETSYVAKNGRKRWTELQRRPLRAGDGWIIVTISRDITERKRAEERQKRHLRLQERTARFGQSALEKRDPGALIDEAVQTVLEGLRADGAAYIEAGAGGRLVLRKLAGIAEGPGAPCAIDSRSARLHQFFDPDCPRTPVPGADLGLDWTERFDSAAVVPVRSEDTVRGLLCAFDRHGNALAAEEMNFVDAVAGVLSTALQRADSEGKLAFLAQFDGLTGLPNRALLRDRFEQMIVQARRHGTKLGVLFIDLDEFKLVNDSLGHAAGDELLKEAARRLKSALRASDTVARIAGDEFAVILGDLARPEDAAIVAQKIIDRLAEANQLLGQEMFVTASVGIAVYPGDGEDAESLLGAADAAMYKAKQAGRNAYQFFTGEITQRTRARALLGSELRRALEREEFTLFYQPKIELRTRRLCGAEALVRWNHPARGLVPPGEFISVLEESGLIVPVGEWVLQRAFADLKAMREEGVEHFRMAVNLSARQFRQQDLAARIDRSVRAAKVDPSWVELEITESELMQDPQHASAVVRELTASGMHIAIDDFGTGYSSLAYLTRFPVTSLKIDRSFVAGMMTRKADGAIVRAILDMAHALGFTVVAEGVETQAQADLLGKLRCEQAQGYLFGRPMPIADLRAFAAALRPPLAA